MKRETHSKLAGITYYTSLIFSLLALLVVGVPAWAILGYLAGALFLSSIVHAAINDDRRSKGRP